MGRDGLDYCDSLFDRYCDCGVNSNEEIMKGYMNCKDINCNRDATAKGFCIKHYCRLYRYGRLHRIRAVSTGAKIKSIDVMHKIRFGGIRETVLVRDSNRCVNCGMSNKDHIKEFNKNLTINHKDHQGRHCKYPNNSLDNLETLCLRCHGSKDAIKHGRYSRYHM